MTAAIATQPRAIRAPASAHAPAAARDMLAVIRCATILAAGAGRWAREGIRLAEQRRRSVQRSFAAFSLCRSPADLIAAQADAVSDQLDLMGRTSGRLSEIVGATAGDAVRALSDEDRA